MCLFNDTLKHVGLTQEFILAEGLPVVTAKCLRVILVHPPRLQASGSVHRYGYSLIVKVIVHVSCRRHLHHRKRSRAKSFNSSSFNRDFSPRKPKAASLGLLHGGKWEKEIMWVEYYTVSITHKLNTFSGWLQGWCCNCCICGNLLFCGDLWKAGGEHFEGSEGFCRIASCFILKQHLAVFSSAGGAVIKSYRHSVLTPAHKIVNLSFNITCYTANYTPGCSG